MDEEKIIKEFLRDYDEKEEILNRVTKAIDSIDHLGRFTESYLEKLINAAKAVNRLNEGRPDPSFENYLDKIIEADAAQKRLEKKKEKS